MKRIVQPKDLSGPKGLVSAIILRATKDAGENGEALAARVIAQARTDALRGEMSVKVDALRYFRSTTYKSHLGMIDKPSDWLPDPK